MIRRLFTAASAISLLACIAACLLWARSFRVYDQVIDGRRSVAVVFHSGSVVLYNLVDCPVGRFEYDTFGTDCHFAFENPSGELDLIGWKRVSKEIWAFATPLWLIVLFTSLPPLGWLGKRVRDLRGFRRGGRGLCPACGYDLRASADRCPECGTAIRIEV